MSRPDRTPSPRAEARRQSRGRPCSATSRFPDPARARALLVDYGRGALRDEQALVLMADALGCAPREVLGHLEQSWEAELRVLAEHGLPEEVDEPADT